jgi:hypothetical protein
MHARTKTGRTLVAAETMWRNICARVLNGCRDESFISPTTIEDQKSLGSRTDQTSGFFGAEDKKMEMEEDENGRDSQD